MHRDGFLTGEEVLELVKAGAVGDYLGWAFNETGELVRASTQQRVTSIQLRRPLKKAGHRVCWRRTQSASGSRGAAGSMDQWAGHR